MPKIVNINRDEAKFAPEKKFSNLRQVTEEVGLTRAEKLTVLRSWAFDVQRRLDAAAEGMAPETSRTGRPGSVTSDTELLRAIELEIDGLENETSATGDH